MQMQLQTLLQEFERLTLDDKVYFHFLNAESLEVGVQFFKNPEGKNWTFWYAVGQQPSKQTCSRPHVNKVLDAFKVTEKQFAEQVSSALLLQAAFCDEFVRETGRILGEEPVRRSIRETQNFIEELKTSVGQVLKTIEPKSPVSQVSNGFPESGSEDVTSEVPTQTKPSGNKAKLRIIRS